MKKEKRTRRENIAPENKNKPQKTGDGAAKAQSPFHAFQSKSLSVIDWIASLKREGNDKKQRVFLDFLEMEIADLILKALKVTEAPTWRVNPRDLQPSSMDRFLFDSIAGLDAGDCETLMELCQYWELELRSEPPVKDGIFAVLVLPFLGEFSNEEKDALGAIYGRWVDLLKDEHARRFRTENAERPSKQSEASRNGGSR